MVVPPPPRLMFKALMPWYWMPWAPMPRPVRVAIVVPDEVVVAWVKVRPVVESFVLSRVIVSVPPPTTIIGPWIVDNTPGELGVFPAVLPTYIKLEAPFVVSVIV